MKGVKSGHSGGSEWLGRGGRVLGRMAIAIMATVNLPRDIGLAGSLLAPTKKLDSMLWQLCDDSDSKSGGCALDSKNGVFLGLP